MGQLELWDEVFAGEPPNAVVVERNGGDANTIVVELTAPAVADDSARYGEYAGTSCEDLLVVFQKQEQEQGFSFDPDKQLKAVQNYCQGIGAWRRVS